MATIMLAPLGMAIITTGTIADPDGRMTAKSKTRPRSWGLFLLSLRIGTPRLVDRLRSGCRFAACSLSGN